jgi:signal transduction histidine kinase
MLHLLLNGLFWLWVFRTAYPLTLAACAQAGFDLVSLCILFHYTGGVESPFFIYLVVHLFGTALILSSTASVAIIFVAAALLGVIAWLEYDGRIAHVRLWGATGLYRNAWFIGASLLTFSLTCLLLFTLAIGAAARLSRQRREAVALHQAARVITSTLDVNEVLQRLLETCATTLNATAGVVRLLSPDGLTLKFAAGYGLSSDYIGKGDVNLKDSVIDQEVVRGHPVMIEDVRADERLMYKAIMLQEQLLSGVVLPIRSADERVLGVLRVYSDAPRHFSRRDLPFLTAMTAQTGIALNNALQFQTLSQLDEAEARFLRTVTHELRAPVAGAQSLIGNLTQGYAGDLTKQQSDILKRIEGRLDFLQNLITDLLDFAAGKEKHLGERPTEPLDITKNTWLVCDSLRDQADAKFITLETNADLLPELWIRADAEDLRRILINLIGNAIKYTPEHGHVSATLGWDETWLEFKVSDDGIGIAEQDIPHIFEEFYRAKNARELERHGTGLGLAIVKQLVEVFEGQITVRSVLGEGTTFTLNLPLLGVGEQPRSLTPH